MPPSCRPCRNTALPARQRVRSGSTSSRIAITLVADALGARRIPSPCRTRHVPTVRKSCQPMPGATGRPVERSHTMLEARWLAMPTPATGPPSRSAAWAKESTASANRTASNSTRPGAGESGSRRTVMFVLDGGVGSHDGGAHARCSDIDDEDAAPRCTHAQGAGPKGEASPNFPGLRMPWGSNVALSPRRTSKPDPRARGRKRERFNPMPW